MSQEPSTPSRPRVAVVFGGRSSEHAISCVTAGSVLAAIDPAAYDVVPVGIATDGRWVLESGDTERLRIGGPGDALPEVDPGLAPVSLAPGGDPGGRAGLVVTEPGTRRGPSARSTSSCRCSTAPGGRTAPCRACSR